MSVQTTFTDAPAIGYAGMPANSKQHRIDPMVNRDAASMPFGFVIAFKPSAATSDQDATLPANSTDVLMGIVMHAESYDRTYTMGGGTAGELDAVGLVPGTMINAMTSGDILAVCEDGCTPGSRLWVRYTTAGTGKGTCRASDAGGSTCIDATKQGEWLSTTAAGAVGRLRINFQNKP